MFFLQRDPKKGMNLTDENSSIKNGKSWPLVEIHLHVIVFVVVDVVVIFVILVAVVRVLIELYTRENLSM